MGGNDAERGSGGRDAGGSSAGTGVVEVEGVAVPGVAPVGAGETQGAASDAALLRLLATVEKKVDGARSADHDAGAAAVQTGGMPGSLAGADSPVPGAGTVALKSQAVTETSDDEEEGWKLLLKREIATWKEYVVSSFGNFITNLKSMVDDKTCREASCGTMSPDVPSSDVDDAIRNFNHFATSVCQVNVLEQLLNDWPRAMESTALEVLVSAEVEKLRLVCIAGAAERSPVAASEGGLLTQDQVLTLDNEKADLKIVPSVVAVLESFGAGIRDKVLAAQDGLYNSILKALTAEGGVIPNVLKNGEGTGKDVREREAQAALDEFCRVFNESAIDAKKQANIAIEVYLKQLYLSLLIREFGERTGINSVQEYVPDDTFVDSILSHAQDGLSVALKIVNQDFGVDNRLVKKVLADIKEKAAQLVKTLSAALKSTDPKAGIEAAHFFNATQW